MRVDVSRYGVLLGLVSQGVCFGAMPETTVDLREFARTAPVRFVEDGDVLISGKTSGSGVVSVEVVIGSGKISKVEVLPDNGSFSCRFPSDFAGAGELAPGMLYVDAFTGTDVLSERAEAMVVVSGKKKSDRPDLPSAFFDDFIDEAGSKDRAAVSWTSHRALVNRFMNGRAARLAGIGRQFDLAKEDDFIRFKERVTLYDFDYRDRDWSMPLLNRPARTFWQAEWDGWFNPGNNHPWDGDKANRKPSNYRPYTFTNDLADLLVLQQMKRSLPRTIADNRDAMAAEALRNLLALQFRGEGNFGEGYTEGAFRYGMFETGEWMEEGMGWFVNPEAGDHRRGGVFNGRSAWALGESLKHDPKGPDADRAAEALALVIRYCLHDGIAKKYTRLVNGLPLWKQAGEHGYLTLGMLAAAEVMPDLPITLDPERGPVALKDVAALALNSLVAALNADGHWTKYPDQDAMGLAALAQGAFLFRGHRDAEGWKAAAERVATGWLEAKHDPAERSSPCPHFGRRDGSRMTYHIGGKPEVHINLYITGLWIHALSNTYELTGDAECRKRVEAMLAYLFGDNPFRARLLNEIGGVHNIVRDTDGPDSRIQWDCYPESTAFVQIGLLHWLDALSSKP